MQMTEIVAKLGEIDQDTALPLKNDEEVNVTYVNQVWPGLISGITNAILDSSGKRNLSAIAEFKAAGFHAFSMNRGTKAGVAVGRVRTSKGTILIY